MARRWRGLPLSPTGFGVLLLAFGVAALAVCYVVWAVRP